MKEIWRDAPNDPGYQVSNMGNVKSCVNNRHGFGKSWHEIAQYTDKRGYKKVHLGRDRQYGVHRLVAGAFIPNPKNYPIVRHLDDNPSNNTVPNLAWGTQKDNMQDCVQHGRLVGDTRNAIKSRKKAIVAEPPEGNSYYLFISGAEASRVLGIISGSISKVVNGQMNTSHGYKFRRYEGSDDSIWPK